MASEISSSLSRQFLSVEKSDPNFGRYITGRFSSTQRALPEASFGMGAMGERVTFRLVSVDEIRKPSKLKIILLALRPSYLTLTLGPVAVACSYLWSEGWRPDFDILSMAFCALMFLHFSVFLFNDYYDHLNGQDRRNPRRGSQIIQKGWEPAYRIQQWAWVNLVIGSALGVWIAAQSSGLLLLVGSLAIGGVLLFPWLRDLKSGPFAELVTFACFGPLLVGGFLLALKAPLDLNLILASGSFGALAVVCVHLKHLEHLFDESVGGSSHLMARLGLDQGRRLLILEVILTGVWLMAWLYDSRFSWVLWTIILAPAGFLIQRLFRVRSPMSSSLKGLTHWGLLWHLGLSVLMSSMFLLPELL